MADDRWIVIPNWGRFQHYGDRRPTWIKTYTALLHKDEYLDLPFAARGLLHGIWLVYAERRGRIREGADLAAELHGRVSGVHLQRLNDAGLIEFSASRPLTLKGLTPTDAHEDAPAERNRRAAEHFLNNGAADEIPEAHLAEALAEDFHLSLDVVDELLSSRVGRAARR